MLKSRIALLIAGVAAMCSGTGFSVHAQTTGYQVVSSPDGYQYQVPSDWQVSTAAGSAGTLASSPDGKDLAYVAVVPPSATGSTLGESSGEVLQAITDTAISGNAARSDYRISQAAASTTVAGADAAEQGVVAYGDGSGNVTDEYILTAVRNLSGYTLVVTLPAGADTTTATVAAAIIGSFALSGS